MQTSNYQSIVINKSKPTLKEDALVFEAPLQININNEPYTVVMRTPDNDLELVRGLLYAEDIYKGLDVFSYEIIEQKELETIINVIIPSEQLGKGYLNKRTLLSVSSCGICGKKELEDIKTSGNPLNNHQKVTPSQVQLMFQEMKHLQQTFLKSGGSHACAIFETHNNLLSLMEDIGRHNAVDKCIGDLLLKKQITKANLMLVSGRVSYEIVSKAFIAKVPIIIAVSACSSLAVDFAKEFGICLIGFCRDDKMTVYANPQYISYEY